MLKAKTINRFSGENHQVIRMSEIPRRKIGGIILSNELDVDMKARELYKIYQQLSEEKTILSRTQYDV